MKKLPLKLKLIRIGFGRVNPDLGWESRMIRHAANEAFGMTLISVVQNLVALLNHMSSLASMNLSRGQQNETRMMMFMVVPMEETLCPRPSSIDGVKLLGKVRPILHRLELRF